ncbi:MAG: hypothetical protein EOP73_29315, partial [Variovorax sp.]
MSQEAATTAPQQPQRLMLFPTLVVSTSWPEAREHVQTLRDTILGRRAAVPVSPATLLGWRSDNDLVDWGGEGGRALCDHVVRRADGAVYDKLQQGAAVRFDWSIEMWAQVTERLGSIQVHSHPGAYLTALYIVDDGYAGSADPALGGELVFVDPRYPIVRMRNPDLRSRRADDSADQHEVRLRPTTGQLLIFPSWLAHGLMPFYGTARRIMIGINLAARRPVE